MKNKTKISKEDIIRIQVEAQREHFKKQLIKALDEGDRPAIVKYMRVIPGHITPEIVNKIADYLDPDRPPIKSGPKQKEKRPWILEFYIYSLYTQMSKDEALKKSWCKAMGIDGNLRNKLDIKSFLCKKVFKISERTFDDILSRLNKQNYRPTGVAYQFINGFFSVMTKCIKSIWGISDRFTESVRFIKGPE